MVENNYNYYLQQIPKILVKKIRQFEEKRKKEINSKWNHIFNDLHITLLDIIHLHILHC